MSEKLPVKFELVPETLESPFRDDFPGYTDGMVRGEPGRFFVAPPFGEHGEDIYNFPLKSDDVWIVTFPKCGTTWVQEILWLLVNDCDFEGAKQEMVARSPFLELPYLFNNDMFMKMKETGQVTPSISNMCTIFNAEQLPSPRVVKSHLPFYLLPPKLLDTCKVVYVARNPKDVIVSFYYHHRLIKFQDCTTDVETFAEYFLKDEIMYAPFFPHILEAWNLRHHPNLHFIFYEDLKQDLKGGIEKLAAFLGKSFTDDQLTRVKEHASFENFTKMEAAKNAKGKNPAMREGGSFFRKGKTGDWKNHFGAELNERIDRWIEANLEGTDLKFITELEKQD